MITNHSTLDRPTCPVDNTAAELAHAAETGVLPSSSWNHWTFLLVTTHLVREAGGAAALKRLRTIASQRGVPPSDRADGRPHETLLVFYVWAVDRLLTSGLSATQVLWHPLVDVASPTAWYHPATLDSTLARQTFVGSDRAVPGEPAPHLPRR
jgi:hypothetical protein